jgi:hypothetical protein
VRVNYFQSIVVEEDVIDALKDLKAAQENVKKRLGTAYVNQNFVFAKTERHPCYPI